MSDNGDITGNNDDTNKQERMSQKKMADKIIRLMKKERPDYLYMKKVFEHVRKGLELKGSAASSKNLPILLTDAEMKALFKGSLGWWEPTSPRHDKSSDLQGFEMRSWPPFVLTTSILTKQQFESKWEKTERIESFLSLSEERI